MYLVSLKLMRACMKQHSQKYVMVRKNHTGFGIFFLNYAV